MNVYFIHSGAWSNFYNQATGLVCDVVFAPTRGRAKSLFYEKNKEHMDDYTSIQMCRLIAKDIDREEGFAEEPEDDVYWEMIPVEWSLI